MMKRRWIGLIICILSLALSFTAPACAADNPAEQAVSVEEAIAPAEAETAIFAGGCFWCMEKPFDELTGVLDTTSGYTGGRVANPNYRQVSGGGTGHVEAVQVTYEPAQVSYEQLLEVFWRNVDPVDNRGQFCDKGSQYRSAIFYQNDEQAAAAEASKQLLTTSGKFNQKIATDIRRATEFYAAEDYHQNYYKTHSARYKVYRYACGRDQRLEAIWGTGSSEVVE